MTPSWAGAALPARILVVRLGSMGDVIHALPAVSEVRRAFPLATIGWAIERRWLELLSTDVALVGPRSEQKPLVDVVHAVDTLAWRRALLSDETWREMGSVVGDLRRRRYDLALDFQGAWKSAVLAQLSAAPRRIGLMQPREKPASLFYTHQIVAEGRHVIEQYLSLVAELCVPGPGAGYAGQRPAPRELFPLPRDPAADLACEQMLRGRGLRDFAIINPGAGWGAKCWPAERYAEVAQALSKDGLRSIVNFGPGEEDLARAVELASADAAVALASTVGELIALTRRARLFVGGDTGPMHLAVALNVPVVALYGPTDPVRSGPYTANAVVLRSAESQTTYSHRAAPEKGLLQITAAEVIEATRRLLQSAPAPQLAGRQS
ncbi:MAG: glycosyltransferase family 9 protein [Terriglobales bacterium]